MGKKNPFPKRATTPALITNRIKQLRERARDNDWGVDAILISNARDIRYLTGFIGDDSWAVVALSSNRVTVISDSRFREQIEIEAPHVAVRIRKGPLTDEVNALMKRRGWDRIGLQASYVTLVERKALAKKLGARRLVAIDDGLLHQRAVKDDAELAGIRKALRIQETAYQNTLSWLQPGLREYEVAAYLEYQMRSLGADRPSFPTIIAADANASLPHAIPGSKKIKKGGVVLIDWGARWKGYCSDLTRVIAIGKMPAKIREIYDIVRDAQQAAIDAIAPGKPLAAIDAVARELISKAGYAKHFGHSLGHGIGLNIHEQPTLASRSKGDLEPGHVVTVEPGIYLPAVGGVRIEDDVLVTQKGRRVLSRLPSDLESAII